MVKKVDLSIVIVNYNTGNFLRECLNSLYRSDLANITIEVLIVDNASRDSSFEKIVRDFPQVKVWKNRYNLGFAKANNQAIAFSSGRYVLLLNPDTVLDNDTILEMLKFMDANPDASVSTCKVILPSGEIDDASHRGFPTPWNALCYFSGLGRIFPNSLIFNSYHLGYRNLNKIHEIDSCVGAFMFIRREVAEKLNWLDEDYYWYGEDLDFCFRAKKYGYKVFYNPNVKIIHFKGLASGIKKHSSFLSGADLKTKIRSTEARFAVMKIFYRKHYLHKYSGFIKNLVYLAVDLRKYFTLFKLRLGLD